MSSVTPPTRKPTHTPIALVVFAWVLVTIPLAYGLYRVILTASSLFTG